MIPQNSEADASAFEILWQYNLKGVMGSIEGDKGTCREGYVSMQNFVFKVRRVQRNDELQTRDNESIVFFWW